MRGGFNLKYGYLKNGYLEGFLTLKIRAMAISKNSDWFLEKVNLENCVRN